VGNKVVGGDREGVMRDRGRSFTPVALVVFLAATALAAGRAFSSDDARATAQVAERAAGSIDLHDVLNLDSPCIDCPAGVPADADCRGRTGKGTIRGLGSVTATYIW
jgi:hypothetical protein